MMELMLGLMVWAAPFTGLPVPDSVPDVKMVEPCEIRQLTRPGDDCDGEAGTVAAYDRETGIMYLPDTWSAEDLYNVSMLLHELVHHMQNKADALETGSCAHVANESPAYDTQIAFLEAAGVDDPLAMMGLNEMALWGITTCYRPY